MKRFQRIIGGVAALFLGSAGITACSSSDEDTYVLHYTTYSNSTSDQSRTAQRFAEEVERLTDGGVTFVFHYSQSLVGADETVQAVLDGRADTGQVGSIYASSDLSMFTIVEMPFETRNPEVQWIAIQRLYEENETYREDFDRQGIRLLFPLPTGIIVLGLSEPAATPDDLGGRSIRSGGLMSQVLLEVGANPVAMTATDIYESMERGVVEGYSSLAVSNLPTFGLTGVSPYLIEPGLGAYTSSIVVINEDLFQSMPEEYREAILEASEMGLQFAREEMDKIGVQACEELRAADTEFSTFSEEDVKSWQEDAGVDVEWVKRYEERGYDAQSVLDDYRRIIQEEEATSDYSDPIVACMEEGS